MKANQTAFKNNDLEILVATKGFGMGIDKSSVRFIVHTTLSSGMESWYQEIGRAGRDEENAHIVLLVDPPNEPCRKDLLKRYNSKEGIPRPACSSYRGGCPHGKEALCDYGKQHLFVTSSYPGPESDAISGLRMLSRLIAAREASADGSVVVNSHQDWMAQHELALYRLTVLGLVGDYAATYRPAKFDVQFTLPESPDKPGTLSRVQRAMQEGLAEHLSHFSSRRGRNIERELERTKEYHPLENFSAKLREFECYERYEKLFQAVYQHLLALLDHTYKDVVKMRYDMLWNLFRVVTSHEDKQCRRVRILPHFEGPGSVQESWRCGKCDVCSPELHFPDYVNPREQNRSAQENSRELELLMQNDTLDLPALRRLRDAFGEYRSATYTRARGVLEGNANNLAALFLTREFSPPEEYEGNAKRLLRTANQRPLPLPEVAELFESSKALKAELLLTLNEADTACDAPQGWKFLAEQAAKPEHHRNAEVVAMRECLDFMLLVEEGLSDKTESLKRKARELENAFYA